jgi:hypothetical protein
MSPQIILTSSAYIVFQLNQMDPNWEHLGRLTPNEKVLIALDMSDACIRICADGIRTQNPLITEGELLEKLRERLAWTKQKR